MAGSRVIGSRRLGVRLEVRRADVVDNLRADKIGDVGGMKSVEP